MLKKRLLVPLVIFVSLTSVFSQDRVKELIVNGGCNYYGESFGSKIYTFESEEEAVNAVDRILSPTGLVRNFDIRAADVPNAAAIIYGETRYILYSQAWMRRVQSQTKTGWAAVSIMAHELGHHLNGHTLTSGGSRPPTELEADSYSGFILYKLGASLEEAQAAMNAFGSEAGSDTHPPKRSRLAAIEAGWTKAKNQDKTTSKNSTSTIRLAIADWQTAKGVEISEKYDNMLMCQDGCGGVGQARFSYQLNVTEAGRYKLIVTYANDDPENNSGRPMDIDVNGVRVFERKMLKRTGGWYKTNAQDDTVGTINLREGENTILFKPHYLISHISAIRLERVN